MVKDSLIPPYTYQMLITVVFLTDKIWNHMLQNAIEYKIYRESCFLMETATKRYLSFRKSYSELEKRVSQAHIASYLGITPVSLSRIRKSIKEVL